MTQCTSGIESVFQRLADSLESSVLPHVADHYAKLQLQAMREMLLNLGTRVQWRQDVIESSRQSTRTAVDALLDKQSDESADLASLRGDLAQVIAGIYQADWDDARRQRALDAIRQAIRQDFDAEAQLIRTGMFGKTEQQTDQRF